MRRNGTSEHSSRRRRADALALIAEESVRSYPSWIAELNRESSNGIDRRRYAYEHLGPGEALALVREHTDSKSDHAVAYYHRTVHLGYVPTSLDCRSTGRWTSPRGHCRKSQGRLDRPSAR